ncbi:transposase [Paracerasibacillus soli]|uniref:Transposase n=2 Tax=Paracerasibacillus soli TaxID=480284 RepID=A0ABU5CVF1_9BACI|nr:transposase [Virgibacillus soli]MDY0410357.1 transposase [Virgibacillus soli]
MHTRIVVVSEDIHYPDKIVPSTGNVADVETPHLLVEEDDATYLMDRGYPSKKNLNAWQNQDILFVVRIRNTMKVEPIETYEITHPDVIRDAKVTYTRAEQPIRLVEFLDEENRLYRLMTTRWDLSAEQIMELYRCRWMIETFFKWVKQHLKLVKIWSTKPQGMWNQMFIAMAAYGLALILQLQLKSPRNLWRFLRLMRIYLYKTYDEFMKELHHKKSRTSRGRQKVPIPSKREVEFLGDVAIIKPQKKK